MNKVSDKNLKSELERYLVGLDTLPKLFEKGDITTGKVVKVKKGEVIVDVGARAEGVVSGKELSLDGEREVLKEGDEILVYILKAENEKGQIELSIRKTGLARKWHQLIQAYKNELPIKVVVIESNNGGVIVNIGGGFRGFIPTSQLDNTRIYPNKGYAGQSSSEDLQQRLAALIGEEIEAKIIELDKEKNRVILSEKLLRSDQDISLRNETLSKSKEGDILEGEVTGIAPFGLFVNAQGLEGLVHLSEISWDKVTDPAQFYRVGDKVKVQIFKIEDGGKRIAYSIKRLQPDPWDKIVKKYKVGQIVKGTVQQVVEFGAFVRIDEGVNGLIHISELSDGLVTDPRKIVKEEEAVEVMIISISKENRDLGLSLKRVKTKEKPIKKEKPTKEKRTEESAEELRSLTEVS